MTNDPNGYAAAIRDDLRALAEPLKAKLAEITQRINDLQNELAELRQTRNELEAILRRLEPEQKRTRQATASSQASERKQQARREHVRAFVETRGEELGDEFTAASVHRAITAANDDPSLQPSPNTVLRSLRELHEAGLIRAVRKVKGGGIAYALVKQKAASHG